MATILIVVVQSRKGKQLVTYYYALHIIFGIFGGLLGFYIYKRRKTSIITVWIAYILFFMVAMVFAHSIWWINRNFFISNFNNLISTALMLFSVSLGIIVGKKFIH